MKDRPDSEYQGYVREVEETLRTYTAKKGYSTYYDTEDRTCFGFGRCNYHELSPDACKNCLDEAWAVIEQICGFSVGAEVLLSGCQMRFEKYDFKWHTLPRRPF
ncbi:hypothetical protein MLD38_027178 [Melastoma candidum]|nr:hypothetical protein MLD38_027178 [Melastoma candidum]